MNTVVAFWFAFLQTLAPTWAERDIESAEQRDSREVLIAEVVASYPHRQAAALVAIGYGETTFARYTLFDCHEIPKGASGDCDKGLARSYWQLHKSVCPPLFDLPSGSKEAVEAAAACALKQWRFSYRACRGMSAQVERSFSHYGGRGCSRWDRSAKKAAVFSRAIARYHSR